MRVERASQQLQRLRLDPVIGPPPSLLATKDPRIGQYLEVMRDGRLPQVEPIGQVTDARFAALARGDQADETQPSRIRDDADRLRQALSLRLGQRPPDH